MVFSLPSILITRFYFTLHIHERRVQSVQSAIQQKVTSRWKVRDSPYRITISQMSSYSVDSLFRRPHIVRTRIQREMSAISRRSSDILTSELWVHRGIVCWLTSCPSINACVVFVRRSTLRSVVQLLCSGICILSLDTNYGGACCRDRAVWSCRDHDSNNVLYRFEGTILPAYTILTHK